MKKNQNQSKMRKCQLCNVTARDTYAWKRHIKSKRHIKNYGDEAEVNLTPSKSEEDVSPQTEVDNSPPRTNEKQPQLDIKLLSPLVDIIEQSKPAITPPKIEESKKRSPKLYTCLPCEFVSTSRSAFKIHVETNKHNNRKDINIEHSQIFEEKKERFTSKPSMTFTCDKCFCKISHGGIDYHKQKSNSCELKQEYANVLSKFLLSKGINCSNVYLLQKYSNIKTCRQIYLQFQKDYDLQPPSYDKTRKKARNIQ